MKIESTHAVVKETQAALKFCFKTCVAMKFVDDDDDDDDERHRKIQKTHTTRGQDSEVGRR